MGNTRNTGYLQNAVKVADNGDISLMHGNTMLMQISASGAITTTGVISGSNALSASYALNATTASFASSATSASYAVSATTASYALSATSASFTIQAQTASSADAFTVRNTLTAQTLVVQTITSSVDFVTGSTRFGSLLDNTHVFSGSVTMNPNGLFVSSSGNVGIGTSTIAEGTQAASSISIFPSSSVSSGPLIQFAGNGRIRPADTGNRLSIDGNALYLNSYIGGNTIMNTAGGNVGIGTLTPSHSLHISLNSNTGSSVNHLFLFNPTGGTSQTTGIRLGTAGGWTVQLRTVENQDWLQIADSGGTVRHGWYSSKYYPGASSLNNSGTGYISGDGTNIGIGTTSPSYKLDVSGTANFATAKVKFIGGSNYNENIRMSVQSSGYSSIAMGADPNSDAGAIAGQWTLVRWPDANANKFSIRHNADDHLFISNAGHITTPSQPAFYAWLPSGTTTATGNYAGFTSVRLNRGGHYNTSTGRFTAPVAGVYRFLFSALWRQQTGTGSGEISISVNGNNVSSRGMAYATINVTNAHVPCIAELIISLNANDYVMPFIYSVGASSDWYMGENLAYFCGYLIG
jgi:hypothetical protein